MLRINWFDEPYLSVLYSWDEARPHNTAAVNSATYSNSYIKLVRLTCLPRFVRMFHILNHIKLRQQKILFNIIIKISMIQ